MCAKLTPVVMLMLFVGSSPARADNAIQKEVARLQGTWQLVSIEVSGMKEPNKDVGKNQLVVKGEKFFFTDEGKTTGGGTFKIVEVAGKTRKNNLTFTEGGFLGSGFTIARWLDDDYETFQTCFHTQKRPTQFSASEQEGQALMTFKRVKK